MTYANGTYGSAASYLIKPSRIGANAELDTFDAVDPALPAGTGGSWILRGPEDVNDSEKIAFGVRFGPAIGGNSDPAIYPGITEVVTYISSRTATTSASEESSLLAVDGHFHLKQVTDNFSANIRW